MSDLVCVCGKELKSKSGLTNHQKKCVVYLDSKEATEGSSLADKSYEPQGTNSTAKSQERTNRNTLLDVPVGSMVMLDGPTYWKADGNSEEEFTLVNVDKIPVEVKGKEDWNGVTWLMCKAVGGQALWAVPESDAKVIKLPNGGPTPPGSFIDLADDGESASQEKALEAREAEMAADRDKFGDSLTKYATARDAKLAAEKTFKKVDKEHRQTVWDYTERYGKESAPGKEDFQVFDFGYNVHIIRIPGGDVTEYDNNAIVRWLSEQGHHDCIKMTPDYAMWDNLKRAGKVPASVIAAFEKPNKTEDKFNLTVKAINNGEE